MKKKSYKKAYKKSSWYRKLRVKINNILHALSIVLIFIGFGVLAYFMFVRPSHIEVVTTYRSPAIEQAREVRQFQMEMNDEYYMLLNNAYPWEVCNLTFYSYRHKKDVTAPQWFRESLYKYHDCGDQLLLTKIAHYESDFNPDSVNLINSYAKGLYHVLPSTRNECSNKYGLVEESDCALWAIKNYPSWYLDGYRPYGYDKSF